MVGDLKVQTEATICAAQEKALRTNPTKNKIDKTSKNPLCRVCGERGETVQHIMCECKKLAQREYKRKHYIVAKLVHWKLCEKHKLERKEKWYEHCPEGGVEDDDVKLIWDINIQCDNVMEARRPDLILVDKKAKSCVIIDVAVPGDCRIREKEIEKIEKNQNLKRELKRLWSLKKVEVIPVVVGALGCISKGFSEWMDTLGIKLNVGMVQKSVLLGTARILRKVLDCKVKASSWPLATSCSSPKRNISALRTSCAKAIKQHNNNNNNNNKNSCKSANLCDKRGCLLPFIN